MAIEVNGAVIPSRISRRKPEWAIVHYKDEPHLLHLRALRRGLLARAIADESSTITDLAVRTGISRSTVSRFLCGRPTSIDVALAVLKELKLRFEDVCRPLDGHLLERLLREGAIIERGDVVLLAVDPTSLAAVSEPRGLRPARGWE